jgi:hemolysin activation/secretion protein
VPIQFRTESDFSVLRSWSWIGRLGWLLILIWSCCPASAQQVLRLLVLGPDTRPIQPTQQAGVDDAAVPTLSTPAARRLTAGFLGRPIDDALLAELRDRLVGYYVSIGRPFVTVSIPAQDIGTGALRVNIIETKRGRLRVEGNRWFDDQQYLVPSVIDSAVNL